MLAILCRAVLDHYRARAQAVHIRNGLRLVFLLGRVPETPGVLSLGMFVFGDPDYVQVGRVG